MKRFLKLFALMAIALMPLAADAQVLSLNMGESAGGSAAGRIIQLVVVLTVLSLAPSLLMMVTSFTRIIVVLSLLRSAIGIQQTPPNPVLISLALFLTAFIMAPTFTKSYNEGVVPLMNEEISEKVAYEKITRPFHDFMMRHVREKDLGLFMELSETKVEKPADTPFQVLIPAFMISELKRSFEIGFLVFIPFLIIDMMIASTLMSMGMMMLPPVLVSLPFKIIFFVLVDGWYMLCGSLVRSFDIMPVT